MFIRIAKQLSASSCRKFKFLVFLQIRLVVMSLAVLLQKQSGFLPFELPPLPAVRCNGQLGNRYFLTVGVKGSG